MHSELWRYSRCCLTNKFQKQRKKRLRALPPFVTCIMRQLLHLSLIYSADAVALCDGQLLGREVDEADWSVTRYAVNVASVCAFERAWLLGHTPVALHRGVGDRDAAALRDEFLNGLHFIGGNADEFAYGV